MKNLYLLALAFFLPFLVSAQSPDSAYKPYLGMVEIGFLYGEKKDGEFKTSTAAPTVQMFNGYRFDELLAIGGTVGIDIYEQTIVTPLALGIRGELLNFRVSPFYSIDAGYAPVFLSYEDHSSMEQKNKGGWMFNPALGLRVKTGNDTAFTFGAGYKSQKTERETAWIHARQVQKMHYKRLTMRMGFMF
jgi:hypothetical protein